MAASLLPDSTLFFSPTLSPLFFLRFLSCLLLTYLSCSPSQVFFATGLPYPEGVYTAGESDQGGERRVQEGPGQSPEMIEMVKVQMQTRLFDVLDRCLCFPHLTHAETVQVPPFLGKKSVFFFAALLCHCGVASMQLRSDLNLLEKVPTIQKVPRIWMDL